jgi:tetratricopeptide (TPR) repeat protein
MKEIIKKKYVCAIVFLMGMLFSVSAQTKAPAAQTKVPPGMALVNSQYYEVWSDGGGTDAQLLSRELDSRFKLYNTFFHFNLQTLGGERLKVRAYKDKQTYDAYISERLDKTSPGAVYLHYSQPDRRELVIHRGSPDEARMLPHQAFVQYLRAFIPYPPSWFREGFAIYFSTLKFDPGAATTPNSGGAGKTAAGAASGGLLYEENLAWLETIKSLGNKAPSVESILQADIKGGTLPEQFQGVSWGLVSFLKDSGKGDYLRILYECFMILDKTASVQSNSEAILNHIKSWTDIATLDKDYKAYLNSRKTFAELIIEGQRAYTAKDTTAAETAFLRALDQKRTHYAPYYYLGLLAYDKKNYEEAEQYYRSAQQYGADVALVSYALGINAASAGRYAEAITFLEQAKSANPSQYTEQVDNLIKRLR